MAKIKNTSQWGRETARERYQAGGPTGTPKTEEVKPIEPLKVDPEGPLGKALLKTKPMGSYSGIKFER